VSVGAHRAEHNRRRVNVLLARGPFLAMPSLSKISANFFVNLITRLGVRPPPAEAFLLSNVVQPVSIVDSDISIPAVLTTQILDTPFTAGAQAAPAVNFIMADTGAQPAGNYQLYIFVGTQTAGGGGDFAIERRDAANAANIWTQLASVLPTGSNTFQLSATLKLQLNERLRIRCTVGAGGTWQASIWLLQVS